MEALRAALEALRGAFDQARERLSGWQPDWTLPPAPAGEDEPAVRAYYAAHEDQALDGPWPEWDTLEEWKREAWRREYRDAGGDADE